MKRLSAAVFKGIKVYLDDLSKAAARQEVLAAWQRGALLLTFMGHSSWHQWSVDSVLHVADVPAFAEWAATAGAAFDDLF